MYLLPFFTPRVSIPPGFDPNCGSVKPKQRWLCPAAKAAATCSSARRCHTNNRIHHQRALHRNKTAQSGIPALQFCVINPYATLDIPAQRTIQVRAKKTQARRAAARDASGKRPHGFCFSMIG